MFRQLSVRMNLSVGTWLAPKSSERRPAVTCRRESISQKRSWACTYPCARNRSLAVCAVICGTPAESLVTVTGFVRPGSVSVPEVCGNDRVTVHTPIPPAITTITRSAASAIPMIRSARWRCLGRGVS